MDLPTAFVSCPLEEVDLEERPGDEAAAVRGRLIRRAERSTGHLDETERGYFIAARNVAALENSSDWHGTMDASDGNTVRRRK